MPNIKPVSDLRNYASLLQKVSVGAPMYLTKNGRGAYAVLAIQEYEELEKAKSQLRLMAELERGKKSGEEKGWLSESDMRAHFENR